MKLFAISNSFANHHVALTVEAKRDLVTAHNDAAGSPGGTPIAGELVGLTLTRGVYADNNAPDSLVIKGTL